MSRPRKKVGGPAVTSKTAAPVVDHHYSAETRQVVPDTRIASRQVNWWAVHLFVQPVLDRVGEYPIVGTPEWCQLPDDDRRKIAAVFDAAQHFALRADTEQEARADASAAIAASTDWAKVAAEVHQLRNSNRVERVVA